MRGRRAVWGAAAVVAVGAVAVVGVLWHEGGRRDASDTAGCVAGWDVDALTTTRSAAASQVRVEGWHVAPGVGSAVPAGPARDVEPVTVTADEPLPAATRARLVAQLGALLGPVATSDTAPASVEDSGDDRDFARYAVESGVDGTWTLPACGSGTGTLTGTWHGARSVASALTLCRTGTGTRNAAVQTGTPAYQACQTIQWGTAL